MKRPLELLVAPVDRKWKPKPMYKKYLLPLLLLAPATSFSADWDVIAHVVQIEPTYVPNQLIIAIDQNAGTCPAGPWLFYYGNSQSNNLPENIKAMYAGVTAALQTGTLIEVYGNNSGCTITNIHFLNHG